MSKRRIWRKLVGRPMKNMDKKVIKYFLGLSVGDYINTCSSWPNAIQISAKSLCFSRGRYLSFIRFDTVDGRTHYWPGGGCVGPWHEGETCTDYVAMNGIPTPRMPDTDYYK